MTPEGIEDAWRPTPLQTGMLFHCLENEDSDVYITYIGVKISCDLDIDRFKRAWDATVQRHACLRASVQYESLDEPLVVIHTQIKPDWTLHDLRVHTTDQQQARIEQLYLAEQNKPLPPTQSPLMRFCLIRLADCRWQLIWTCHHLLADGWSTPIILAEISETYQTMAATVPQSLPKPFNFADYISAQAVKDHETARSYWAAELAGVRRTEIANVPVGHRSSARARKEPRFNRLNIDLSKNKTAQLQRCCRDNRLTLSTVIHSMWALILSEYSGSTQVLFGTSTAGRPADLPGIENAVGPFLTSLPLVVYIDESSALQLWLRSIQEKLLRHMAHEYFPLAEMTALADTEKSQPLFDTMVVVEGHANNLRFSAETIQISDIEYRTHSHMPLVLLAYPGEQLTLTLVHDLDHYENSDVLQLAGYIESTLQLMIERLTHEPAIELLPLINLAFDRKGRRNTGVGSELVTPAYSSVNQWFETVCDEAPDDTALVFAGQSVTYQQLEYRANQIGRLLLQTLTQSNSSQQQKLVGLFLERGIDLVAAMLASLKIGVAYVPLDPAYPAQRTHQIIQSAQLCLVVSTRQLSDKLDVRDIPVVDTQVACGLDGRRIDMIVTAQHLAYVIFTSGSTGEPKGVCISHENLMYSTMARTVQYVSAHNRFLLLSSVAFDSSVAGIFGTLCSGGTLIIPQPGHERELNIICELIHTHCVSRTLMLPSLYRLLLQHGDAQQLNSLEVVIVAGEPCPPALVALHFELNQSACLFNEYGPTETCVWSTVHECAQSDQKVVPIGRPIAESQCFVLNERCQPCPPGIIGELYLAGRGVCAGYLGSSDDVGDPFLKPGSLWQGSPRMYRSGDLVYWSPAQELVYVGRKDRQVKIRGHRVEPAEIESIISRSENVNDVAVVIRSKAFDVEKESGVETQTRNHQILVYYIPSTVEINHDDSSDSLAPAVVSDELNRVSLIEMAGQSLPSYMRPSAWIALDRMPRLPNGKVDLKNLPDPVWTPNQTTQITTKADPRIEHLCQILAELLGHEKVHASDNFFDLGGDSIIAIQFVSKARNAGYDLTVASVIVSGAIADMNNLPANAVSHQGHIQATGKTRLSPIQNWFFSQRHPQPQHWNLAGVVAFNKRLDTDLLEQSIRVCVARFPELGASFHVQGVQGYAYIPNATPPIDLVLRGAATDSVDDECGLEFWESIVNPVQMGFELETGWLLRFIMLPAAHSHMGGLIWVAHHLVVDPVSMDLILGSIESEYCKAINDGRQRSNTAHGAECASVGYRHWAEVLADQADQLHNDRRVSNDAAENAFRGPPSNIFAGISAARSTEADKKIQQLDTNCLSVSDIESINQTFGTRTQELLVLVLMETMCELQQLKSIRFDIETHGRDLMSEHLVADQSVGWFSNLIAVALTPSESPEWRHRIKTFKEFFRRATDRHAFDLLEHYRGIRDDCDTPLQAVLFNYHGRRRVDLSPERLWRHEIKTWPFLRAQQNHCSYIIEVNVWHTENHLRWHWQYVQSCMDDERFHALCTLLESRFRSLGSILSEGTSREFTPSDFPDLDIDQAQLDEFLDSLE